ncbi:MAG: acetyltransferase [Salinarimonadaceae bacterium]|nr:MAG: acetyltransferase [Salinarimonadaceae bacterium]
MSDVAEAFVLRPGRRDETAALFAIWEAAVAASHDFVTPADLAMYARLVRENYLPRAKPRVAAAADGRPVGFIGVAQGTIEALFVDPSWAGRGCGRALVADALAGIAAPRRLRVDVNEQNEGARAFYARLGFKLIGRSRLDACGRPYPILHLEHPGAR